MRNRILAAEDAVARRRGRRALAERIEQAVAGSQRAGAAIDKALAWIEKSNRRIEAMERQHQRAQREEK